MQAVILAGGEGTRLRPYTVTIPKPLMPVGEYPILDIIIRQLRYYGVREIIISTGYLAELIEVYFRKGNKWGVSIRYVREGKPLGTAGALKNIKGLKDNFIVMNGDVFTNLNFKNLYTFHLERKSNFTIGTMKRKLVSDFGVLKLSRNSRLVSYTEKAKRFDYVSTGINVLNKRCQRYIVKGESIGIPELVERMQSKNENIYCYKSDCYWLDIGRIEDFQKAQEEFQKNKEKFLYI